MTGSEQDNKTFLLLETTLNIFMAQLAQQNPLCESSLQSKVLETH